MSYVFVFVLYIVGPVCPENDNSPVRGGLSLLPPLTNVSVVFYVVDLENL